MGAKRTIFIAGAGIAGLTLALAVAKTGARAVVIERNADIGEAGAGLQISPNARRVLNGLGLDAAMSAASFEPQGIDIIPDRRDAPIQTLVLGVTARERYGLPYAVMHRGDLAGVLYAAALQSPDIEVLTGVSDCTVRQDDSKLAIRVRTPEGRLRRSSPFAFIGADGVRSETRTALLGGPSATPTGTIAWRALLEPRRLAGLLDLSRTTVLLGPDHHAVIYPLPHRGTVNVVLFTPESAGADRPRPNARHNRRLAALLDLVGSGWTQWPLATVETGTWHKGSIGIIGDAAHAMLPFQAQGAAMGIEDAAILAPLLINSPNAETALSRYAALRQPRVRRVMELSARNGRIFHMNRPLSLARDAVIAAQGQQGHFSRLDWLYGYDAWAPQN